MIQIFYCWRNHVKITLKWALFSISILHLLTLRRFSICTLTQFEFQSPKRKLNFFSSNSSPKLMPLIIKVWYLDSLPSIFRRFPDFNRTDFDVSLCIFCYFFRNRVSSDVVAIPGVDCSRHMCTGFGTSQQNRGCQILVCHFSPKFHVFIGILTLVSITS